MPLPKPNNNCKTDEYCKSKGYKLKGTKQCKFCDQEFGIYLNRDFERKKFCSSSCRAFDYAKNHVLIPPRPTKETRKKIGESLSKKMKLGLIKRGGLKIRGENHPNWIPDRSLVKKGRYVDSYRDGPSSTWRKDVFKRDKYTCQYCGVVGGKLNAHHIKEWAKYPEYRYDISNGLTLCVNCHKKEHRKKK